MIAGHVLGPVVELLFHGEPLDDGAFSGSLIPGENNHLVKAAARGHQTVDPAGEEKTGNLADVGGVFRLQDVRQKMLDAVFPIPDNGGHQIKQGIVLMLVQINIQCLGMLFRTVDAEVLFNEMLAFGIIGIVPVAHRSVFVDLGPHAQAVKAQIPVKRLVSHDNQVILKGLLHGVRGCRPALQRPGPVLFGRSGFRSFRRSGGGIPAQLFRGEDSRQNAGVRIHGKTGKPLIGLSFPEGLCHVRDIGLLRYFRPDRLQIENEDCLGQVLDMIIEKAGVIATRPVIVRKNIYPAAAENLVIGIVPVLPFPAAVRGRHTGKIKGIDGFDILLTLDRKYDTPVSDRVQAKEIRNQAVQTALPAAVLKALPPEELGAVGIAHPVLSEGNAAGNVIIMIDILLGSRGGSRMQRRLFIREKVLHAEADFLYDVFGFAAGLAVQENLTVTGQRDMKTVHPVCMSRAAC